MAFLGPLLHVYPVSNYTFGSKVATADKDQTPADMFARMQAGYEQEGLRTSVHAVLVVNSHNHPHVLVLQTGASFKLPGGKLKPGESEVEGLKRKLHSKLAPASATTSDWEIGECLATWWRPNFDSGLYPYCPPHVTRPKEMRRLFAVHLPEKCFFAVPKNMKLLAVPMFELFDNVNRYGHEIAALPQCLSRYHFDMHAPPDSEN